LNTMNSLINFINLCFFDVDGDFNNCQFEYSDQDKFFELFGAHDHYTINFVIPIDVTVKSIKI